jgi:hypothetical protein
MGLHGLLRAWLHFIFTEINGMGWHELDSSGSEYGGWLAVDNTEKFDSD